LQPHGWLLHMRAVRLLLCGGCQLVKGRNRTVLLLVRHGEPFDWHMAAGIMHGSNVSRK
jgi:hypothetical protein